MVASLIVIQSSLSSYDKEISAPNIVCEFGLSIWPCSCVRIAWLGKSPSVYRKVWGARTAFGCGFHFWSAFCMALPTVSPGCVFI